MTTLAQLLAQPLPPLAELRTLALVLTPELVATLAAVQSSLGPRQFQVQPIQLTNGNSFLVADVLTEIDEDGLYRSGFSQLPSDSLTLVQVKPLSEVLPLIPVSN